MSQVSGTFDQLVEIKTDEQARQKDIETAKQFAIEEAVRNGALRETCTILDVTELNMSYVTLPVRRLKVKAVGSLQASSNSLRLNGDLSSQDKVATSPKTMDEDEKRQFNVGEQGRRKFSSLHKYLISLKANGICFYMH